MTQTCPNCLHRFMPFYDEGLLHFGENYDCPKCGQRFSVDRSRGASQCDRRKSPGPPDSDVHNPWVQEACAAILQADESGNAKQIEWVSKQMAVAAAIWADRND